MKENNMVFIGLGSNLGNREENLAKSIDYLSNFVHISDKSRIYETEPVGKKDQNWFLNMVIKGETNLSPEELLAHTQKIEKKLKRKKIVPKGPRTIDLDILFYNDLILNSDSLTIPHLLLHERKFVLKPLSDIAPDFIHPVLNESVEKILNNLQTTNQVNLWTTKKLKK